MVNLSKIFQLVIFCHYVGTYGWHPCCIIDIYKNVKSFNEKFHFLKTCSRYFVICNIQP